MEIKNTDTLEFKQERSMLEYLAPAGYHLGLRWRFGQPQMQLSTIPDAWAQEYTENAYVLRDPLIAWAVTKAGAIRWSDLELPDHFGILERASAHGLNFGVSFSIGERQSRTILALCRSDREFTDEEMAWGHAVGTVLHRKTGDGKTLTIGQRNALRMIAEGWKYPQAAERLGIAEGALKARLVSVRKALGVDTTPEAIMTARGEGLI
jgi:LuxR family transcriptional regulator, quorum-sensing system regulator SdiA